jgi:hypothetical protein
MQPNLKEIFWLKPWSQGEEAEGNDAGRDGWEVRRHAERKQPRGLRYNRLRCSVQKTSPARKTHLNAFKAFVPYAVRSSTTYDIWVNDTANDESSANCCEMPTDDQVPRFRKCLDGPQHAYWVSAAAYGYGVVLHWLSAGWNSHGLRTLKDEWNANAEWKDTRSTGSCGQKANAQNSRFSQSPREYRQLSASSAPSTREMLQFRHSTVILKALKYFRNTYEHWLKTIIKVIHSRYNWNYDRSRKPLGKKNIYGTSI